MMATGIALAASVATVGADPASATAPTLRVKNGAMWTAFYKGGGCEIETFSSHGTFASDKLGDKGTWSGGATSLNMNWTGGSQVGWKF